MIIIIRLRLKMDERVAICNLMRYQIILIQTVESILIKKQIKVILFIIISLLDFSQFSLSAVFMKFLALHKSAAPQQISQN